jgi:hypothetical protein
MKFHFFNYVAILVIQGDFESCADILTSGITPQ